MNMHPLVLSVAFAAASGVFAQVNEPLERLKSGGSINLGVRNSSAFSYALGNGKYGGFHTEMAERIIDDLGKRVGRQIGIAYVEVTVLNRMPLVQNGTVDLECGSTVNTVMRQKEVAFADTTYVEEVRVAVKSKSDITNVNALNGKTVVSTADTTHGQALRNGDSAKGIDFAEVHGQSHADSFLLLESGRADAFIADGSILASNISRSASPSDFKILGDVLSVEPIACMLRKDDAAFKQAVNDSIRRQIANGSLAELYDKWFTQPVPPNNRTIGWPMSEATKAAWASPNDKPRESYTAADLAYYTARSSAVQVKSTSASARAAGPSAASSQTERGGPITGASCPTNLGHLASKLPAYEHPQVAQGRQMVLSQDIPSVIQKIRQSGITTTEGAAHLLKEAQATEAMQRQTEQCVRQVSTNPDAEIQSLRNGTFRFGGRGTIQDDCAAIYVLYYYKMVGEKEVALAVACHASAGR